MSDEWNPLANTKPVTLPVKSAGVHDTGKRKGEPRATITGGPWSGRERLAYEDGLTTVAHAVTADGIPTLRTGSYRTLHAVLTLTGSSGFPKVKGTDGKDRDMFTDPAYVEDDLMLLGEDVFEEVLALAAQIQPRPGFTGKPDDSDGDDESGHDTAAGAPSSDEDDESDLPDPSTPSTRQAASAAKRRGKAARGSESPAE